MIRYFKYCNNIEDPGCFSYYMVDFNAEIIYSRRNDNDHCDKEWREVPCALKPFETNTMWFKRNVKCLVENKIFTELTKGEMFLELL